MPTPPVFPGRAPARPGAMSAAAGLLPAVLLAACAGPSAPMSAGHLRDIRPGSTYAIRTLDAETVVDRVDSVSGDTLHLAAGSSLPARHVSGMEEAKQDNRDAKRDAGFVLAEAGVMAVSLLAGAALLLSLEP